MRVRIWNAYASNNSGSYSIVGSFATPEDAAHVAAELLPVIAAHSAWCRARDEAQDESTQDDSTQDDSTTSVSPMGRWASDQGLRWAGDSHEEWPAYSGTNTPQVLALGSQVLIHEDYTVTLPSVFGEFFYRRGGRVEVELNHAHHPLIAVLTYFVPWNTPGREERELDLLALRESLASPDSALRPHLAANTDVVVRDVSFGMYWFEVAAIFSDLVAGVRRARDLAEAHDFRFRLHLTEAWSSKGDPLEHLRSTWATDPSA